MNTIMDKKNMIEALIKHYTSGNKAQFAKFIGVSPQTISAWIARNTFDAELLYAKCREVNPAWLLTGTGEMFPSAAPLPPADELRPRIPLTAVAGRLPDITSSVTLADCEMLPAVRLLPPYKCTIIIQGDSMEPKFEGGDEIAIREVVDYIEWGKTYVLDTEDGPVLKRLYDDGDSFRCVSYNPDYPPFTIEKQKVYRVFKVVGLIRRCN